MCIYRYAHTHTDVCLHHIRGTIVGICPHHPTVTTALQLLNWRGTGLLNDGSPMTFSFLQVLIVRGSIVASISACHADDPGSIPGRGEHMPGMFCVFRVCVVGTHRCVYDIFMRTHTDVCPTSYKGHTRMHRPTSIDSGHSVATVKLFWCRCAQ